jgi:hypothetical protein
MATTAFAEDIENRVGAVRDKVVEVVREAIRAGDTAGVRDVTTRAARIARRKMADAADLRDEAIYRIKRQPVKAVALAFGAGALTGVVLARLARECQGMAREAKPESE